MRIAAALLLLILPLPARAGGTIAPGDRADRDVEVLCAAGLTGEPCPESRPLSRDRVARMLAHAHETAGDDPSAAVRFALADLDQRLRDEKPWRLEPDLFALARPARAPIRDSGNGARIGGPRDAAGFDPTRSAGRLRARGEAWTGPLSLAAAIDARAETGGHFAPTPAPPPDFTLRRGGEIGLAEANATLLFGPVLLRAGRQPLSWGPGDRGNLILSGAAAPIDAIRVGLDRPVAHLAPDLFVARLEDPRGHPLVLGQRFAVVPTSWATLGAQRVIVCCEAGSDVHLGDLPTILAATRENVNGNRLDFDQLASADASVSLPANRLGVGARAWYEWGGTDYFGLDDVRSAGGLSHRLPHLLGRGSTGGAMLSRGALTLRGEEAAILPGSADFYANSRYPEGYSWEGMTLGHPAGGRALSTDLEATWSTQAHELTAYWLSERYNVRKAAPARRIRLGVRAASAPLLFAQDTLPLWIDVDLGVISERAAGGPVHDDPALSLSLRTRL